MLFGNVILTGDVRERGLRAGDVGTGVERHVVLDVREDRNWVEFFGLTSNTAAVVTRARECAPLLPRQPIDQPLTYGSVPISKSSTTSSPTEDSIADQDAIEA